MEKSTLALISVVVGAGIGAGSTLLVSVIQRRWQREDTEEERQEKERALTMTRGEELLAQCQQLVEWKETARKVALTREWQGFVPTQGPMFRIAAIVELFFPELSGLAQTLDNAVLNYLHQVRGIAMIMQANGALSGFHRKALHDEQGRLEQVLATFMHTARQRVRERISSG
jgi:hypothetical protein